MGGCISKDSQSKKNALDIYGDHNQHQNSKPSFTNEPQPSLGRKQLGQIPSKQIMDQTELNQKYKKEQSPDLHKGEWNCLDQVLIAGEQLYQIKQHQLQQTLHKTIVGIKAEKKYSIGTYHGSGVLLSRNIILTAAHNIFIKEMVNGIQVGEQLNKENCRIYLEGDGSRYYEVEDWTYPKEFITASKGEEVQFDYAIVKLKQKADFKHNEFLQVSLPCECILKKEPFIQVNIYGYPLFEPNYKPINKKGDVTLCQFGLTKKNCILEVEPFRIKYLMSTVAGQSGCPVAIDNKIIGVHKGGVPNKYNFGRLVTKDVISSIKEWCKELKGDPFEVEQYGSCPNCENKIRTLSKSKLSSQEGKIQEANKLKVKGDVKREENQLEESINYYSLALDIYQRVKGKGCFQSAATLHSMGLVYKSQLNYTKALEYYSLALEIREKVKGKGCFESADTLHNLGNVYYNQLNYTKALEYYSLALDIYQRVKGKGYFESANTLHNMGLVYYNQLNYTKALEYYSLALEIKEKVKGKGCFQSADTLHCMGSVYYNQLNYTKALEYYSLALDIYQRVKGKGCFQSAVTLHNMGLVYYNQLNYTKALEYYSLALEIKEKVKGKGCFESAATLNNMAMVYDNQLNYTKALEYYSLALEIKEKVKGKGCFESAATLNNMAMVYDNQLNYTKALEYYSLALEIFQRVKGKGCFESAVTLYNMGFVYSSLSNHEAATQSFSSSLLIYEKYSSETDARDCAIQLAKLLEQLKKQAQLSQIAAKYGLAANEI